MVPSQTRSGRIEKNHKEDGAVDYFAHDSHLAYPGEVNGKTRNTHRMRVAGHHDNVENQTRNGPVIVKLSHVDRGLVM